VRLTSGRPGWQTCNRWVKGEGVGNVQLQAVARDLHFQLHIVACHTATLAGWMPSTVVPELRPPHSDPYDSFEGQVNMHSMLPVSAHVDCHGLYGNTLHPTPPPCTPATGPV
jgi:hypothetical protein